jgi:hypothetical protein
MMKSPQNFQQYSITNTSGESSEIGDQLGRVRGHQAEPYERNSGIACQRKERIYLELLEF